MTNPSEFEEFNRLLTSGRRNYVPWYILLGMGDKDPSSIKRSWKHPTGRLPYKKALEMIKHGMNIGIAGTDQDMLVIIDVDDETNIPDNEIKATLSCRSSSRTGTHHFYFATDQSAKLNIPTEEYGEVRGQWQYVVCAGSYVPRSQDEIASMPISQRIYAGQYTIERKTIARSIQFDEFPSAFKQHMADKNSETERAPDMRTKVDTSGNKSALFDLSITDVVGNHPTNERFPSLFHGSKTGSNTSISDNQIHCFRHNVSLTPLRALAVLAGIDTCMNAGLGHARSNAGNSTIDLRDGKTIFTLWKYAKEQGMIPQTDPIPTAALTWFAIVNSHCTIADMIDGWKLPTDAYCEAKDALIAVGLLSSPHKPMHSLIHPDPINSQMTGV